MWESGTYGEKHACDYLFIYLFSVRSSMFILKLNVFMFSVEYSFFFPPLLVVSSNLNCCCGSFFQVTLVTEKFISQYPPSSHNLFSGFSFEMRTSCLLLDFFCHFPKYADCGMLYFLLFFFFLIVFDYRAIFFFSLSSITCKKCNNELGLLHQLGGNMFSLQPIVGYRGI